jgi:hypothetical protein
MFLHIQAPRIAFRDGGIFPERKPPNNVGKLDKALPAQLPTNRVRHASAGRPPFASLPGKKNKTAAAGPILIPGEDLTPSAAASQQLP